MHAFTYTTIVWKNAHSMDIIKWSDPKSIAINSKYDISLITFCVWLINTFTTSIDLLPLAVSHYQHQHLK